LLRDFLAAQTKLDFTHAPVGATVDYGAPVFAIAGGRLALRDVRPYPIPIEPAA